MSNSGNLMGAESGVYVVAEMSANHLNDFDRAIQIIEAASETGADAVKLQTYTADSLSLDIRNEYFKPKSEGEWEGWHPYELFKKASTPYEWQPRLKEKCDELGLDCFSSPFDREAVDFMEEMEMPIYKIASLEINDLPLIRYAASKGKPMIMSTGAANLGDIERAVNACRKEENDNITLLKCTSDYPAPIEKANLRTIPHMRDTFDVKVGLSDHTLGTTVPVAATALRAQVIEKHLTLDRSLGGPDASFSLEPDEFKAMVEGVREAEKAVGNIDYSLSKEDRKRRRSLFVVRDVEEGNEIKEGDIRSLRPGDGLSPAHYSTVIGMVAVKDLERGMPIRWEFVK